MGHYLWYNPSEVMALIRYAYICNQVLQLYKKLPSIKFPLDPRLFFEQMDNCKTMTYNKFAELNQCPLQEVFALCESKSGCTHYDVGKNRYLILFNSSRENHNVTAIVSKTSHITSGGKNLLIFMDFSCLFYYVLCQPPKRVGGSPRYFSGLSWVYSSCKNVRQMVALSLL